MSEANVGGCLCGQLRYEVQGEPLFSGHCHCRTCQRAGGGPMGTGVGFSDGGFRLTAGEPKLFTYQGDSGKNVTRRFCGNCGATVYSRLEIAAGLTIVAATTFDDQSWIQPERHVYMASAQPWDPTHDDLPKFDKLPF